MNLKNDVGREMHVTTANQLLYSIDTSFAGPDRVS